MCLVSVMSDDLLYWKNGLLGILGPIHENDPQCGWYRTRPKKGYASLPVRIWKENKAAPLSALRAGRSVDPFEVWTWCCMNPVSEDAYNEALESGDPWPDGVPSSHKTSSKAPGAITPFAKASAIRLKQRDVQIKASDPSSDGATSQKIAGHHHKSPHHPSHDHRSDSHASRNDNRNDSRNDSRNDKPDTSSEASSKPNVSQSAHYPSIGHNSAQLIGAPRRSTQNDHNEEPSSKAHNPNQSSSRLDIMLDPFADAREMSDHIALLWDDVSSWLKYNGPIVDQIQADRCANYASALSNLEALSEDMRVREKKPYLDAGRSVDAKWKPVIEAAKTARSSCKNAIEPFLVKEWLRLEALSRKDKLSFLPPKAGSYGRGIALRHVQKIVITEIEILSAYYSSDERLLKNEAYRKILKQYADDDVKAGKTIPGAKLIEERSVS